MQVNKKDFSFIHKNHECHAYIDYDGISFEGVAKCHPKDEDFESKKTGEKIASLRALEKLYFYLIKKCWIEINALKTVKNALLQSGYQKDDEVFKSINKQIHKKEILRSECITEKRNIKFTIYNTISSKEFLYKSIRELRKQKKKS